LERVQRQLEALLGEYPSGLLEGAGDLPGVPSPPPVGIPAQLIGRRPDLIAAERRLAAADSRLSASRAALYPRISLTASGGTVSEELGDLLSAERVVWTILGNLVQPIFQGGRLLAQVDARAGRKAEAIATFAQQALGAFSEVEQALAVDSLLATREEALRRSAQNAEVAVVIAQNRYAQGIENLIVVLESQRRALDARSAWLAVRRERLENRIDLHLALGGGFNVPASATDIPSSKGPKQ
jgi:outer membrane protein TolC